MTSKQIDAPFKFLVRPVTTVNVAGQKLWYMLEDEIFSSFNDIVFCSPISGILVLPGIMDSSIVEPPPGYVNHQKRDNSVSVAIKMDFGLWQRSSQVDRLGLLADNIRCSLDKIPSRYLTAEDRQKLNFIVDKARARLVAQLQG